ncbi:MAG: hypothetical protein KKB03_00740 [Nanoarchaeota archaeon]|nr:hypothetical protein [Nanoarchaeota archaeon]MBU1135530.1 hypothetical protein [Nanoarchaeota archaeon]MBU2519756.1 hypothetical protein [Nanoarchaeota archaeon]
MTQNTSKRGNKLVLDGNVAAAWGARLARAQVVPNFPVTPQTEIIETLAEWKAKNLWKGEFLPMESEHSVMSAAVASSASGARTFTATSSQGLLLMHEILYVASGMRLPIVMANVSRALSSPINIWCDHNDILDQRDSGWMIFFCENNQEVIDHVIQGFKIGENINVLLPTIVNMDGFTSSYTREPIELPDQKKVNSFLPKFNPKVRLDPKKPMALGAAVIKEYSYFRSQIRKAHKNALGVIKDVHNEWNSKFKRDYKLAEPFMMSGAKVALVTMGSNTTIAKAAIKKLRSKGKKVGLVKLRLFRPFPESEIKKLLSSAEAVCVVDQNISPGSGGIVYPEIKSLLCDRRIPVSNYIAGIGGAYVTENDFEGVIDETFKSIKTKKGKIWWHDRFLRR